MRKAAYLFAFVMVIAMPVPYLRADEGSSIRSTFENTLQDLGTRETATRRVDGLTITYPSDEADVVDLLLPDIHDYRVKRAADAKIEAEAIVKALSDPALREKYRIHIAALLGLESLDPKTFGAQYDAALKQVANFTHRWQQWSGDLSSLTFWNGLTAHDFQQGDQMVFPEIRFGSSPTDKTVQITIIPPYLTDQVGAELIDSPAIQNANKSTPSFRLDIPLIYAPGEPAEKLAQKYSELFSKIPDMLQSQLPRLAQAAQRGLLELLLRSTIQSEFFTKEAGLKSDALVDALARYYLVASLKSTGAINSTNEQEALHGLLSMGPPKSKPTLSQLEALDPFSSESGAATPASEDLQTAESRLELVTLLRLAQGGEDGGLPIFAKLKKIDRLPKGGFTSVPDFGTATEAAYPDRFQEVFLGARTDLVAHAEALQAKAKSVNPPKSSPGSHPDEPSIPNRETLESNGLTITFPASLRAAAARLAPKIAEARQRAAAHIAERRASAGQSPSQISEPTLDYLRSFGLTIPRDAADTYAAGAAVVARSKQVFLEMATQWNTVQIWFKDDLKDYLTKGGQVEGFTYDPSSNKVSFEFNGKAPLAKSPAEAGTQLGSAPHPPIPMVLTDRSILDLKDAEAQAALLREKDKAIFPMLESAANATDSELGLSGKSPRSSKSTDDTFFVTVHELVEADLVRHVIASQDRRWFCEGMANLLAIRAYDHQFGAGNGHSGRDVFKALYDPARLGKLAAQVDLLDWPTVGNEPENLQSDDPLTVARYYFATLVLLRATEGRGDDFIKQWIAKIRETPWNRTNVDTVIDAYDKLTGQSLREMIKSTVVDPTETQPENKDAPRK